MVNGQAVQQEFGIDSVKVVTLRQRRTQVLVGRQKLRYPLAIKVECVGAESPFLQKVLAARQVRLRSKCVPAPYCQPGLKSGRGCAVYWWKTMRLSPSRKA